MIEEVVGTRARKERERHQLLKNSGNTARHREARQIFKGSPLQTYPRAAVKLCLCVYVKRCVSETFIIPELKALLQTQKFLWR